MLAAADQPFPSSVELVLRRYAPLIDARGARSVAFEAAVTAMAPATKAAITADLKCFLAWCKSRRPVATAVPVEPETLVHYLRWLARSEEHTSELQSIMRISYAVFYLTKHTTSKTHYTYYHAL